MENRETLQRLDTTIDPKDPIIQYFNDKINNPDPGSDFDTLTKELRENVPQEKWLSLLLWMNYRFWYFPNGISHGVDQNVYIPPLKWYIAYQKDNDIAKVFRFEVEKDYRGNWLSVDLTASLISILKQENTIKKIQIGKGLNETQIPEPKAVALVQKLCEQQQKLSIEVDRTNHTISR